MRRTDWMNWSRFKDISVWCGVFLLVFLAFTDRDWSATPECAVEVSE